MRGLDCNDRLPVIATDGELSVQRAANVPGRSAGGNLDPAPAIALVKELALSGEALWIAVPSRLSTSAMGELLRELRAAGARVQGFVDAAVAVAAWLQKPAPVVALDMGSRGAVFGIVSRDGDDYRLRRSATLAIGSEDLMDLWVRLAAESMVRQTRFDPLHDQVHEAAVRAALPAMLASVEREAAATFSLSVEGREIAVTLSRDQFATAAADALRPLATTLQGLCAALGECQIMVPEGIAGWPGIDELLAAAGSRPVWVVTEGVAARAASLLPATPGTEHGAVQYLTQLPPVGVAPADCARRMQTRQETLPGATHLVFRGRAIPIGDEDIVIGRDPDVALRLPEGIAGLSRRHCTLRRSGNETVLIDHSQFGTFVDGQRVDGRALLRAGSSLRVGTPGIELPLVSLALS